MLFKWLKEDNIDSSIYFLTIEQRFIKDIFRTGAINTINCSKTLKRLHPEFLYCPTTTSFFQFKNHRWCSIDKGYELRNYISELEQVLMKEIMNVRDELSKAETEFRDKEEEGEDKDELKHAKKNVKDIEKKRVMLLKERNKLLDTPFREKIMKECIPLYLDREFNNKKDTHIHLVGFTNGVLDLEAREFREGKKEDYITLTTKYDFDKNADTSHVNEHLSKIFPDPVLRDFHIKYKAHCLYGSNPNKTILFQTNKAGNNGKSTQTELDLLALGQYGYVMPSSFLSYVDKGGSGAKADIIALRGKRMVFINEPNEKLGVNVAHLKEFRGNDDLSARGLFEKDVSTFKNQSKLIISCNKLIDINSDDNAFFNSIKVLDFEAQFSENAPESEAEQRKQNHFLINKNIIFDLPFIQGYMKLLWETYLSNGIELEFPHQVEFASRAYQARSDPVLSFIRENTKESEGMISYTELYGKYNNKSVKKTDFIAQVKTYKMFTHLPNGLNNICFREEDDEIVEVVEQKQKVDNEFETLMMKVEYTKDDKKFKRIQDVIKDFDLPKTKSTSMKIKEFFMRRGITIIDDKSNGHKIFIKY
jgi:P4 family phage/plasmid primase-like protien